MPYLKGMRSTVCRNQRHILYGVIAYAVMGPPSIEPSLPVNEVLGLFPAVAASKLNHLGGYSIGIADE